MRVEIKKYEELLMESLERKPEQWGHGAHVYPADPIIYPSFLRYVPSITTNYTKTLRDTVRCD